MTNQKEIVDKLRTYILTELISNTDYDLKDNEPMITGGLIDSYDLVHIAVFIEDNFSVYLPDTDFTVENMDNLSLITKRILKELN